MIDPDTLPDDFKAVNCAGCGEILAGESVSRQRARDFKVPRVRGRILGRPFCGSCLAPGAKHEQKTFRPEGQALKLGKAFN